MNSEASWLLVDAHVHVHADDDAATLLSAAAANLAAAAQRMSIARWQGVLMLAEMSGRNWFASHYSPAGPVRVADWLLTPTAGESIGLRAEGPAGNLLIVAGRQIATAERIEVLALGTRTEFADGQSLGKSIQAARATRAVVVLPWAAGKWLGARGWRVAQAFRTTVDSPLYAGDNGGRPVFWPRPRLFAMAERQGRPVLPGSDPLPLPGEQRRAGSVGLAWQGQLTSEAPAQQLLNALQWLVPTASRPFGRRERPRRFIRNQLALRRKGSVTGESVAPGHSATPDIETSSAAYARRFEGKAGRYLLDVQSRAVSAALRDLLPGTALDVGGGHGQLVSLLRQHGWQVTVHGTDAACERNLRELHGQRDAPFLLGNLYALPAADRSFDLVIAVRLLSHVTDWPRLLEEMCRVARHAVVVDYPSTNGLNALTPLLFGLKRSLEGNTRTYSSFSRRALDAQFGHYGFGRSRAIKQFLLPMVVHRVCRAAAPLRVFEAVSRAVGLTALVGSPVILRADRLESKGS